MRKKIVAGNWKMNLTANEGYELAAQIEKYAIDNSLPEHSEIIIAPPFLYLETIAGQLHLHQNIKTASQNCHQELEGAYTGAVSAKMLASVGIDYVIIGHSERRSLFNENNALLKMKVDKVLESELQPIFCCGEQENIRDAGKHKAFVEQQLEESLFHLGADDISKCIIAYEPVWAIGTGKTASPQQAQDMHQYIRFLVNHKYGEYIADEMTILYGGSCKPSNAAELFANKDVDGGLIGGASLKTEQFIAIIEALK